MAVRFDASTDRLSRTTSLPPITAFTLMGWFKISTDRNNWSAFLNLGVITESYYVGTGSSGTVLTLSNSDAFTGGTDLTVGTWYHIAMTLNGTGASAFQAYLNGVLDISMANASNTESSLQIGNSVDDDWLDGCVAAVKVYDTALTAAEIQQEMRQYLPHRTANLNAWYPLLSTADDEIDFFNGRTLTVGGTLATEAGPPIPWRRGPGRLWIPTGGAGDITGTFDVTQDGNTVASAGVLPIVGAFSVTQAGQALSADGTSTIAGAAAVTQAAQSLSSTTALLIQGAAALVQAGQTLSASGSEETGGAALVASMGLMGVGQ